MRWIEAVIPTSSGEVDALCESLSELGVEGVSIEDEADFRRFLEENRQYWDYVDETLEQRFAGASRVKFYLQDDAQGASELARIRAALGREIEVSYMEDEDWENGWKKYYAPIPVGERLLIVPEWQDADPAGRTVLRLDPGIAFGTGSHATTRMCLEALEGAAGQGKRVLDLGCGSGILGIGALVLGAKSCLGCDIDPKAPDVVRANAALNGIGADRLTACAGDILSDASLRRRFGGDYALVLSNIVSDVIIPLSRYVRSFLAPDGIWISSGIIEGRQDEVRAAIEQAGFTVLAHRCEEEWHCFVAK